MNIQHSSRLDAWETPQYIIDMVHEVLGGIDLDPASSHSANERVQAGDILTEDQDALNIEWPCDDHTSLYINPPGGKVGRHSKTGLFWQKLMRYRQQGMIKDAIFMFFSIEALQVTQNYECPSAGQFLACVPSKRIKFIDPTNPEKVSPSHSNMIVYVPGSRDRSFKFKRVFEQLGVLINE